jgi:hypothetical protein
MSEKLSMLLENEMRIISLGAGCSILTEMLLMRFFIMTGFWVLESY